MSKECTINGLRQARPGAGPGGSEYVVRAYARNHNDGEAAAETSTILTVVEHQQ